MVHSGPPLVSCYWWDVCLGCVWSRESWDGPWLIHRGLLLLRRTWGCPEDTELQAPGSRCSPMAGRWGVHTHTLYAAHVCVYVRIWMCVYAYMYMHV